MGPEDQCERNFFNFVILVDRAASYCKLVMKKIPDKIRPATVDGVMWATFFASVVVLQIPRGPENHKNIQGPG